MGNFWRLNNILGWIVFAICTTVFILTLEPTASYWDCGEFIAVSYKLEVPHPPGAPLFLMIGRIFSFLAMGDAADVAYWINLISALSSGFAVLFLFWTIAMLGRKLMGIRKGEETTAQGIILAGASTIGALSFAFSDSFWFSAVEAEVYAMSSFFTALVFWAILKWETIEDEASANRWLIFIAYMLGLSIGVHLLNLVCLPVLAVIYYFKRHTISVKGIILTLAVSGATILLIMNGIITGLPSIARGFEIFFVNNVGLPFGSGIVVFLLLLIGGLSYGIWFSIQKNKQVLNTAILSLVFILIGYSSYAVVVIRSNYDTPIDENNPENIISFVSYLKREQYGTMPSLFYGPYFTTPRIATEKGAPVYWPVGDKYEIIDHKLNPVYEPKEMTIFPRAWSEDAKYAAEYRRWMGLKASEKPNFLDNLQFFFRYQIGHSYLRYFLWNFSGRASDIQNDGFLTILDIGKELPQSLADNKGRNNYFMLPLLLGLLGLFFQYKRDPKNFAVVFLLFILTGLALIVYLNIPATQPRERDYIYVGSFYTFTIWIGFGVMAVYDLARRALKGEKTASVASCVLCLSVPIIMISENWDDHDRSRRYFSVDSAKNYLSSCAPNAILFTGGDNDTFPLWYVQEVEGFRTDVRVIVQSYFNTDWYVTQMTRPAYESDPLPFLLEYENFRQGGPNDYLPLVENPNLKGPIDANQFIKLIKDKHPALQRQSQSGSMVSIVPGKTFSLRVDENNVKQKKIVPKKYENYITPKMIWDMKGGYLGKADLMTLDLIAQNNWERPIYFNNTSLLGTNFNLRNYVVQEGITFRLLPIENPESEGTMVNTDVMFDNLMEKFQWRGLDDPTIYYTADYRNFVLNHRSAFNTLAETLIKEGDGDRAKQVLLRCLDVMPDKGIPFDYFSARTMTLLTQVGENDKAKEMAEIIGIRADENLKYLTENNISDTYQARNSLVTLNEIVRSLKNIGEDTAASRFEKSFSQYLPLIQ